MDLIDERSEMFSYGGPVDAETAMAGADEWCGAWAALVASSILSGSAPAGDGTEVALAGASHRVEEREPALAGSR
jgi:hypothetical protein